MSHLYQLPSLILVLGRTSNAFISYQGLCAQGPPVLGNSQSRKTNETILVKEAERVEWAVWFPQGQVALENLLKSKDNDDLLRYGIQLVSDGIAPRGP